MASHCGGTTKAYMEITTQGGVIKLLTDHPPFEVSESANSSPGIGSVSWAATYARRYSGTAARGNCTYRGGYAQSGVRDYAPGPFNVWASGPYLYCSSGNGTNQISSCAYSSNLYGCAQSWYQSVNWSVTWRSPPSAQYAIAVTNALNEVEYASGWMSARPVVTRVVCGCPPGREYCGDFPEDFCCFDADSVLSQITRIRSNIPPLINRVTALPCYKAPPEP